MENENVLLLDEDESEHLKQIDKPSADNLDFAIGAAVLALNGLTTAEDVYALGEPLGLTSLLLAKCANGIRLAVTGLKTGYYSGAEAVLRSAFEALAFGSLFHSQPDQVAKWFRNQFTNRSIAVAVSNHQLDKIGGSRGLLPRSRAAFRVASRIKPLELLNDSY